MWLLWTILLLSRPLWSLGTPLCSREPFKFLVAIKKILGNRNDGTLYTPDDLSVCPAETLGCFRLELSVIRFEEGPTVETVVLRLQRLLEALGARLWPAGQGPCPPCQRTQLQPQELGKGGENEESKFSLSSIFRTGQSTAQAASAPMVIPGGLAHVAPIPGFRLLPPG